MNPSGISLKQKLEMVYSLTFYAALYICCHYELCHLELSKWTGHYSTSDSCVLQYFVFHSDCSHGSHLDRATSDIGSI